MLFIEIIIGDLVVKADDQNCCMESELDSDS